MHRLAAEGYRAAPRLYGFGLAAAGSNSAGVRLRGLEVRPPRDGDAPRFAQLIRALHGAWQERGKAALALLRVWRSPP